MTDRKQDEFAAAVRASLGVNVDLLAVYPATVVSAKLNSVHVVCDDKTIGGNAGIRDVPLRHGLPGCDVIAKAGNRVLVGFENADPSGIYASMFLGASDVDLIKLAGGGSPIARVGDLVDITFPATMTLAGTITPLPPAAGTFATTILTLTTGVAVGVIKSGNQKLLA